MQVILQMLSESGKCKIYGASRSLGPAPTFLCHVRYPATEANHPGSWTYRIILRLENDYFVVEWLANCCIIGSNQHATRSNSEQTQNSRRATREVLPHISTLIYMWHFAHDNLAVRPFYVIVCFTL